MALETLVGIKSIGTEKVQHLQEMTVMDPQMPNIIVDHVNNTIVFRLQNGPTKEKGKNGCQVDDVIRTVKTIIEGLDAKFHSSYNTAAIGALELALNELAARKTNREIRQVEGTNAP